MHFPVLGILSYIFENLQDVMNVVLFLYIIYFSLAVQRNSDGV